MTFRAILDDGKEHKPVLLMLTGQMTPRQIDKEYRCQSGLCPDCEDFFRTTDQSDGGTFAVAMAGKDRSVSYRRGHYLSGTDDLLTQMHFAHKKGYLQSGVAPCSKCTMRQLIHKEAVEAIAHQYRQDMPKGFRVDAECQFIKPGTPPETYRPDIVVFNAFGGKHTCIEYQRSPEKFESFIHRHQLRGSEWGSVIWFFDKKIWERTSTCEARDWLFDNGQTFYKCWVDEETMQLQVEEGTFATALVKEAKGKRRLKKFVPQACSIADIINEYLAATGQEDDGRRERVRQQKEPLKADRLQGFNLVEKSEADRAKNQQLFETLKRQKAQREEDERRRREYDAKMNRLERIQSAAAYAAVLGDVATTLATLNWTIEELDRELIRLHGLREEADDRHAEIKHEREHKAAELLRQQERRHLIALIVHWRPVYTEDVLAELADKDLRHIHDEIIEENEEAKRQAEEAERVERLAKQAAANATYRAEQERIAAERQHQWELANAKEAEHRRQQREYEAQWRPIEARDELVRGEQIMKTLVMPGSQIRKAPGWPVEVYQGVTGAGYSTDKATYNSLIGWQIFKPNKPC